MFTKLADINHSLEVVYFFAFGSLREGIDLNLVYFLLCNKTSVHIRVFVAVEHVPLLHLFFVLDEILFVIEPEGLGDVCAEDSFDVVVPYPNVFHFEKTQTF